MSTKSQKAEVMAPAGSFAAMEAAINAGCDSVYFGVEQLNMRARASSNFRVEDLPEVTKRAKKAAIKTYIAMNTLLYNHDMDLMKRIMDAAKEAGITACIIADVAAMQYAREIGMTIHASTQLSISNYEAVKFYSAFADVMVLAREVDLKMMAEICRRIKEDDLRGPGGELVKIEVFVHGALCIAQSGRCTMSILQTNTSAQRGACLQECRKKYRVIDEDSGREMRVENGYVLSPKDLCTIGFLDKLVDAGVEIFKIEGRGRSPQYVDMVVNCYREARDSVFDGSYSQEKIEDWMKRLKSVYNRGFSEGYYLGRPLPEWSGSYGSQATEERTFAGLVTHYFSKSKVAEVKLQANELKIGDRIVVMGGTTGVVYADVEVMRDEKEKEIKSAKNPSVITIPVSDRVRKNDKLFILKKRTLTQDDKIYGA